MALPSTGTTDTIPDVFAIDRSNPIRRTRGRQSRYPNGWTTCEDLVFDLGEAHLAIASRSRRGRMCGFGRGFVRAFFRQNLSLRARAMASRLWRKRHGIRYLTMRWRSCSWPGATYFGEAAPHASLEAVCTRVAGCSAKKFFHFSESRKAAGARCRGMTSGCLDSVGWPTPPALRSLWPRLRDSRLARSRNPWRWCRRFASSATCKMLVTPVGVWCDCAPRYDLSIVVLNYTPRYLWTCLHPCSRRVRRRSRGRSKPS